VNADLNTVSVLGVRVSGIDKAGLLELVQEWAVQSRLRTLVYVNAYCLNTACTDTLYRNILNQADLVYPDGISVVWAGRWLDCARLEKLTGRVWLPDVCKLAVDQNWSIYLLAGRLGVADQAAEILKHKYPGLRILGAADGFFINKSEAEVLQEITALKPHILFVGMGAPVQEKWCALHRTAIRAPIVWAVGSLFDTVTGIEPLAPSWFNALALEWLWRLLRDPRGKWRRYLIGNPQFVWRVFHQKYLRG
jgi:N-acetylglucosaminyldiphosphoundecaprenol N-acetyl-beta-D-mannosaminyltransferase